VDALYAQFVTTVARNRGLSEEKVRNTEADVFTASESVAVGLADLIQAPQARLSALFDAKNSTIEDLQMQPQGSATAPVVPEATAPVAAPEAAPVQPVEQVGSEAATAERTRIAAILKLPEAESNAALANHFALGTDMTVEQAQAALAVAAAAGDALWKRRAK